MTLGEAQRDFTLAISALIAFAYDSGYELTFGEAYRTPEQAILNAAKGSGIINSVHTKRLAVDFNLFRHGVFLSDSEDHKPLGEKWKSLHELARWGGDFTTRDGNHYSFEWEGIK